MAKRTTVRITTFSFDEFVKIKEILLEWNYEWLEYDLIHDNEMENVDVTFYLEEGIISLGEFVHLMHDIGSESVFRR
ncbi:hypothetical protein [Flavobacterium sp. UBA7663]|uniref:hypothetical protein n=1 Tax=Flavobacterium sp. UBA7663 TaxID=1946557 RepID=UPI0025B9BD69|nr:hypothetical protein [Flavobacterium sp. UBA7663]